MSNTAKTPSKTAIGRNAQTGAFIGRAKDSTVIESLPFKPVSFTVRELRKVIRDVRSREQSVRAG